MSTICPRLQKLLDEAEVEYEVLHHRQDFRARTTAADTHTPEREFAKTLLLWIDGEYAIAAVPASHFLSESRLARSIGAEEVRLATEYEMENLISDCEVGAAPPFGMLYELPTSASPVLARDEQITFNAGTHRDAVRMAWADYERLVKPEVLALSRHEEERV